MNSNGKKLSARPATLRFGVGLVLGIIQASLILSCTPIERITPTPVVQPLSTTAEGWSTQPETNFGFILEYGLCYTHKLDAFEGEFTQDRVTEPSITIPLKLSVEQLKMIYQKMVEIDLAQYPAVYAISTRPHEEVSIVTPARHYHLTVVNGKSTKTVSWIDEIIKPTAPEADKLRELLEMIIQMISENPDVMDLPGLPIGCQ